MTSGEQASEAKRKEFLQLMDEARKCQQENKPGDAQGKRKQARRALEESLEICKSNHKARILLVSYAINEEEYDYAMKEALIIYNDLSKERLRKMKDPVLLLSIAHAAKMLSDIDKAIFYAKEATQLYSDDPQPYMILGELYAAAGKHVEAEQQCRQALLLKDSSNLPKRALSRENVYVIQCCLGASLVKQLKYNEAELFLTQALETHDRSTLAMHHLVNVYCFQNRQEDAMKLANYVQKLDPSDEAIKQKIELIRKGEQFAQKEGVTPSCTADKSQGGNITAASGPLTVPPASKVQPEQSHDPDEADAMSTNSGLEPMKKADKVDVKNKGGPRPAEGDTCMCCMDRSK